MKKRALSLLLALVMIFGLLPVTARAATLDNGLEYEVYEDHVEITDYTGDATEVVILAEIEGLPVTSIGEYAFTGCSGLVSIDLPDSITSIGMYTFYGCSSLISINLPDSITSIGSYAFCNCTSLTSISIPEGVTYIRDSTFANCTSLTGIHVDENNPHYSSDDRGVLFDKEKTKLILAPDAITGSYDIPNGVISIGENAFDDCTSLTNCNMPDSVTSIGNQAFEDCTSLTSVTMPDSLTSIGKWAFYGCSSLVSIGLPDSLTYIGARVFAGCTRLTSITVPEGVADIGDYAFEGCTSLTGIHVDENNLYYSSDDRGVLFNKEKTELIQAPGAISGSYAIPDGVTNIADCAFMECSNLTDIELPDGITEINMLTFYDCTSLASIKLPGSLTYIGEGAFGFCTSLTSISIPESVTYISDGYGMYDDSAFSYCTSLTEFHVDANNLHYSSDSRGVLFDKEKTELIQAPGAIAGSYVVPNGVTSIGDWAFYDCTGLTSINLPDSLTSIGYQAFLFCDSLTGIHVDNNNLHYSSDDRGVLFDKEKTELILAPGAIAGSYAIPDGVTSIGDWAFYDCESLINVSIADGVTSIGYCAFLSCKNLTNISIPSSVTSIDNRAFDGCERLTIIIFKGDAPEFGGGIFNDVIATAYYPAGNPTWTADVMQDYGGTITWVPYTPTPFTDVPVGSFYADPVAWALENGITDGTSDTTFSPDDKCLRSQVVTFLHRAAKNPEPTATRNPFTDVKSGDYFYKPVLWAVENGITDGVTETSFGSKNVCTRGQVVTFLWRAAGEPAPKSANNPFSDVKSGDYFYTPVLWAVENGITDGVDDTHFAPNAPCTRAQVVTFLHRANN